MLLGRPDRRSVAGRVPRDGAMSAKSRRSAVAPADRILARRLRPLLGLSPQMWLLLDLSLLNVATFRERISGGANQGKARDSTRKEVTAAPIAVPPQASPMMSVRRVGRPSGLKKAVVMVFLLAAVCGLLPSATALRPGRVAAGHRASTSAGDRCSGRSPFVTPQRHPAPSPIHHPSFRRRLHAQTPVPPPRSR